MKNFKIKDLMITVPSFKKQPENSVTRFNTHIPRIYNREIYAGCDTKSACSQTSPDCDLQKSTCSQTSPDCDTQKSACTQTSPDCYIQKSACSQTSPEKQIHNINFIKNEEAELIASNLLMQLKASLIEMQAKEAKSNFAA